MLLSAVALVLALFSSPYAFAQGGPLCTGVQMGEMATKHASGTSATTAAARHGRPVPFECRPGIEQSYRICLIVALQDFNRSANALGAPCSEPMSGSGLSVCIEPDITRRSSHVYEAARDKLPTVGVHAPYALHSR